MVNVEDSHGDGIHSWTREKFITTWLSHLIEKSEI